MSGTTVRITQETHEVLRELERKTGERTPELLARAVDQFRRSLILAETNAAYGALPASQGGSAELENERADWVETLADGLDD